MNHTDYSIQLAEELITQLSAYLLAYYPADDATINLAERSLDRTIVAQTLIKLIDERIRLALASRSRSGV